MEGIISDYDSFYEKYAEVVDSKPIHTHYERPAMWSLLPNSLANLTVLDAGCGSGWYSEQLLNTGAKVTAVDASQAMVNLTAKRTQNKARCITTRLEDLASVFPAGQFNLIVAPLVIHYIKNWQQLFSNFANILLQGGEVIFSFHHPHMIYQMFTLDSYFNEQIIEDRWDNPPVTVKYYHHTLHELSQALFNAGFVIERLLEPYPPQELQHEYHLYEKMQKNPWFLFVRAKKQI